MWIEMSEETKCFNEGCDVVYPHNSVYSVCAWAVFQTLLSITLCDSKQYIVHRSSVSGSSCINVINAIPSAAYVALDAWAPVQRFSMVKHLSYRLFWSWSICSNSFSSSRMRHNGSHFLPTSSARFSRSSWDTRPGLNGSWAATTIRLALFNE